MGQRNFIFIIGTFLFVLLFSAPSGAKNVQLFDADGNQVSQYGPKLQAVQNGDVLEIGEERFEVISHLGSGGTTYIAEVKPIGDPSLPNRLALRLPLNSGIYRGPLTYLTYIEEMGKSHGNFDEQAPIPKLYRHKSWHYLAMEIIPHEYNLLQFFEQMNSMEPPKKAEMIKALTPFAEFLSGIAEIGDFKAEQIVYNPEKKQWVLLDWFSVMPRWTLRPWANPVSEIKRKLRKKGVTWTDRHPEAFEILDDLSQIVLQKRKDAPPLPLSCRGIWKRMTHSLRFFKKTVDD